MDTPRTAPLCVTALSRVFCLHSLPPHQVCAAMGRPADGTEVPFDITDRAYVDTYFKDLHHPIERQGEFVCGEGWGGGGEVWCVGSAPRRRLLGLLLDWRAPGAPRLPHPAHPRSRARTSIISGT
jgi:hypothetical protein